MSDIAHSSPDVPCPLCEGRGKLPKSDLFDRLREKDLAKKIETFMACVVDADRAVDASKDDHIQSWNLTHFLWRRSPKE